MNGWPNPASETRLSTTRRRSATAIRWVSLPLAVVIAIAPLGLLRSQYQRAEHLVPTIATVIDARVVSTSRVTTEWDAHVRYPVHGQRTENSVRIWTSIGLDAGETVTLLVDPATGDAEDDLRPMSWLMAALGLLAAAFFLLAGFRGMGAMLKQDRQLRQKEPL